MAEMDSAKGTRAPLKPVAVITGATRGIGRALAEEFAKNSHAVLLVGRNETALAELAQQIAATYNVGAYSVACDLATPEGCDKVEDALQANGLYCESLVNNAAMMTAGHFQDQDRDTLLKTIDLNLRSVLDLTRRFLPDMIARGAGGVLNVSSVEGFMPVPYQATYAATKAAMISWSRALAYEVMGTGVRVCMVAPGVIETDIHATGGAENSYYALYLPKMTPERLSEAAYRRFKHGNWIIIEGWLNRAFVTLARFVPGYFLIPTSGWFFRVRDENGTAAEAKPLPHPDDDTPKHDKT
ncbi:SDR family NAD(P)-dependent oxidoreductase [Methyloceanibacter caenitepidi]|uniref:SDR family NAD(P)-dependent oxidoreductase n=1 Tax=Methyloceanibacter caenitepidi TaxID=1384459 RepID=UPI0009E60EE9|nr:SDR family oxidoreductase [Methyloceanibacter caenitepidi]